MTRRQLAVGYFLVGFAIVAAIVAVAGLALTFGELISRFLDAIPR